MTFPGSQPSAGPNYWIIPDGHESGVWNLTINKTGEIMKEILLGVLMFLDGKMILGSLVDALGAR